MEANKSTIQQETEAVSSESVEFRITKITLYVLILMLSCVGNSLVAIVIIRARGMRTSSNLLIFNLALCDFITPTLSIPFDLALEELNYVWPFGKSTCKVLWPFQTAFSTSATLILAAISLDRFRTLANPFIGHFSLGKNVLLVLIIHAFSMCLCIPYFVALDYNDSTKSCDESWPGVRYRQAYTVALFLCQYALPLITMTIAYILIYHSLRSNLARLCSMDPERRCRNFSRGSTLSKDSMEFKRKEQNIRLAKMFVIVVVVFAISMFPNQVLWLWVDFGNGAEHEYFYYISAVCRICTYANSVLNPFIYALKSKEFRSGFARIGRTTVMQPLRKISAETRKFVHKVSWVNGNVLDNQRPIPVQNESSGFGDVSEYSESFKPSSELSRETKLRSTFERQNPVPRRKFPCYDIGDFTDDFRELCAKPDFTSVAPIHNGFVEHFAGQERHGFSDCVSNTPENMNSYEDISLLSAISYRFIKDLPETEC